MWDHAHPKRVEDGFRGQSVSPSFAFILEVPGLRICYAAFTWHLFVQFGAAFAVSHTGFHLHAGRQRFIKSSMAIALHIREQFIGRPISILTWVKTAHNLLFYHKHNLGSVY
jgi:hypothetical protein